MKLTIANAIVTCTLLCGCAVQPEARQRLSEDVTSDGADGGSTTCSLPPGFSLPTCSSAQVTTLSSAGSTIDCHVPVPADTPQDPCAAEWAGLINAKCTWVNDALMCVTGIHFLLLCGDSWTLANARGAAQACCQNNAGPACKDAVAQDWLY